MASAAIVALSPQFIYQSAAINNDVIAALAGTGVLIAALRVQQSGLTTRHAVELGAALGLALISKLQVAALTTAIAVSLILAAGRVGRSGRLVALLKSALLIGGVAAGLAGWWYVRNLSLYGDLTGMATLDEMWHGRNPAENLWAIGQGLPQLWASLWGRFGYGQIPVPGRLTTALLVVVALCLTGLARLRRSPIAAGPLATLVVAVVSLVGAVLYYMARQPAGAMGRFLFPALPAIATLVVAGLEAWLNQPKVTALATTGVMSAFAMVAIGACLLPAVSYPPRQVLTQNRAEVARVGDVAILRGVELDDATSSPGGAIHVQVNWEPLRQTTEPLSMFVHVIDEAGVMVAQRDTWPGMGRAPTTSWRPGVPFVDRVRVDLPDALYAPNVLTVTIGLAGETLGRLPVIRTGMPGADNLTVASVTVPGRDSAWTNPLDVNFADAIHLVAYDISPRALPSGTTLTLTTVWDVATLPDSDPHIFAQVLGEDWRVWGSNDGGHPEWTTGVVTDTREIALIPETPSGSYPLNVGLVTNGRRSHVIGESGQILGDFASLGPIAVR